MKTQTKLSHTVHAYPVVGITYKFVLGGARRRLVCTHEERGRYYFADVDTGYNLNPMNVERFRYLLRRASWSGALVPAAEETKNQTESHIGAGMIESLRACLDEYRQADEDCKAYINARSRHNFADVALELEVWLDLYKTLGESKKTIDDLPELKKKIAETNGLMAQYRFEHV